MTKKLQLLCFQSQEMEKRVYERKKSDVRSGTAFKDGKWQEDDINKRMEHARRIYNQMLADRLKVYNEITKAKEWRQANDVIRKELAEGSSKKSERLKEAYAKKNQMLKFLTSNSDEAVLTTIGKFLDLGCLEQTEQKNLIVLIKKYQSKDTKFEFK